MKLAEYKTADSLVDCLRMLTLVCAEFKQPVICMSGGPNYFNMRRPTTMPMMLSMIAVCAQIMFKYQPELAAAILPNRVFQPALGPLWPINLIVAPPALYGFQGCSCFGGYRSIVSWDAEGMGENNLEYVCALVGICAICDVTA